MIYNIKGGVILIPAGIISVGEWLVIFDNKPFCEGSDAGSLVIAKDGAVGGLLGGATFSNVSTSAIITDMHTVIASIKDMAGLDIQIGT